MDTTGSKLGFNPAEVFEMLHQLEPDGGWLQASLSPKDWLIWLDKGAYGLKDAPLLWFLRIQRFMREHSYVAMKHDSCMFYKLDAASNIDVLLSLHVDDTLATGSDIELAKLHKDLEKEFGPN